MSKYSNEFKLKVIEFYQKENYGVKYVADYFNIPSSELVRRWIKKYEKHGISGIIKNQKLSYDDKFKQSVIEYMHNNHLSCVETAFHFNIGHRDIVDKWERIYYEEGPQALYEERRGRKKNMSSKPRKSKLAREETEEDLVVDNYVNGTNMDVFIFYSFSIFAIEINFLSENN